MHTIEMAQADEDAWAKLPPGCASRAVFRKPRMLTCDGILHPGGGLASLFNAVPGTVEVKRVLPDTMAGSRRRRPPLQITSGAWAAATCAPQSPPCSCCWSWCPTSR